jgi:hypothetical protein
MTSERPTSAAPSGWQHWLSMQLPALLIVSAPVATVFAAGGLPPTLQCSQAANRQLAEWESLDEFLLAGGGSTLRSPTARIGTWVEVRQDAGRITFVARISADGNTLVTLDAACQARIESRETPAPVPEGDVLTDHDVESILRSNDAGVFYAWSPHMPLSVDGWEEIRSAAEALGIAVTPVLSSHANIGYARDRALRIDMPASGFALNQSVELNMRDLNVHAPAILVYSRGRFASPVIPGFRYTEDYEAVISRYLGSR